MSNFKPVHPNADGNRHDIVTCPCCYGDGDECALCGGSGEVEASVAHDYNKDSR
jgi:hypothetical protein